MHHKLIFVTLILFTCYVIARASTPNIIDLLTWDLEDGSEAEKRDESSSNTTRKSCVCNGGPSCMCCVDFNITYFDFGGPGCVFMKYKSQEEGIAVNVSYGDSVLHSQLVKGPNPEPACISVLVNLVKVCARFSNLIPVEDGLKGCLQLEPKLLGDVQTTFKIGCFTIGPDGMKEDPRIESDVTPVVTNKHSTRNETGNDPEEFNEVELLAVVNETAEQGLAFFGDWLGLFEKSDTNVTENNDAESNSQTARSFVSVMQNKV